MLEKLSFIKKKPFVFGAIVVVLVIVLVLIFKSKNTIQETITVKLGDFLNQVSASGKVVASDNVDLGFKSGGRVEHINFLVGQNVKKGQAIANFDSADVRGSLEVSKANYEKVLNGATNTDIDVAKAQVTTAQTALDQIKMGQDILVKNAKKDLLNSGFIATTNDQLSTQTPPIISGTYLKEAEGQITITPYSSSGGTSFQTSGLIDTTGMASIEIPQPIGDTGLYIKFSNTLNETKWIVNIPNKQSPNYLNNLNAYQTALSNQTQAVANAEAALNQAKSSLLQKQASARPEDVAAAYGQLLIAEGAYNDKFIFAPFDGVITKMDAKVGEIASPNVSLITMMGVDTFQIESYVPEVNISLIKLNDEGKATLDAYGDATIFPAKVVSIDPAETIRDGVSTYKIKLQFENKDDRIKSGMTANVSITTFDKPNVIVVPGGVVFDKGGKKFVQMKIGDKISDREVVTGSVSSLGQVEIISGLSDGDVVILNPIVK